MLKYIYTTLFVVFLFFSISFSYAGILEDENAIIQQGEQLLHNYNQEHNTNFLYTDVDALPDILMNLYEAGKTEDMKALSEGFALKNRVSIYEQFTPEQNFPEEGKVIIKNNYSPFAIYNRNAAKNYALYWAKKRNTNYEYYVGTNNGQNFVSQVLFAGGLPYTGQFPFGTFSTSAWYYNTILPSNTWGQTHYFYGHAMQSNHYTKMNNNNNGRSQLQIGDIIQMDIGNNGTVNHSMVVTKKTGNNYNQIYVTYNVEYDVIGNGKKDFPLDQAIVNILDLAEVPNASYTLHLWKVNY